MKPPLSLCALCRAMAPVVAVCLASTSWLAHAQQESPTKLEATVKALMDDEEVLSIAVDGGHLYTGHKSGFRKRDASGRVMREWGIGCQVQHLAVCQGKLFVGTPAGLFQLDTASGVLERVGLNWGPHSVTLGLRYENENTERIRSLAASDRIVWVGTVRTLRRFDLVDKSVRVYTGETLGIGDTVSSTVESIVADETGTWVEACQGLMRLNAGGDMAWFRRVGSYELQICGVAEDSAWAIVSCGHLGIRPCRIDAATGDAKIFYFGATEFDDREVILSELSLLGSQGGNDLVFDEKDGGLVILRDGRLEKASRGAPLKRFVLRKMRSMSDNTLWVANLDAYGESLPDLNGSRRVEVERSGEDAAGSAIPLVTYRHIDTPSEAWMADRRLAVVPHVSQDQLRKWMQDSNGVLRAKSLAHLSSASPDDLRRALEDPHVTVREAALWRVLQDRSPDSLPLLREAMADVEPSLRDYAVMGLLERGERPGMKHVRQTVATRDFRILRNHHQKYAQRYVHEPEFWKTLAAVADVDVLLLMAQQRVHYQNEPIESLGKVLAAQPAALEQLPIPVARYGGWSDVDARSEFALRVGIAAGPAILPTLHQWLTAEDHVRRVYAAVVCGGIRDRSSLKPLLDAFQSDDGLALGAITTALGKLGDPAAIPALTGLYPTVAQDISLLFGGSPRVLIRSEALRAKYAQGKTAGSGTLTISGTGAAPVQVKERPPAFLPFDQLPGGSMAVTPPQIAEAIEEIGAEHAQPFYLSLIRGTPYVHSAYVVARGLRPVEGADRELQVKTLKGYLRDRHSNGEPTQIAQHAAITLLHFGIHDGDALVLQQLDSKVTYPYHALKLLLRVPRAERAFANDALQAWRMTHADGDMMNQMIDTLLK